MVSSLQLQIVEAVRDGVGILEIEDVIIDPAPLDAEEKAALWLYAEAIRERHNLKRELLGERGPVPITYQAPGRDAQAVSSGPWPIADPEPRTRSAPGSVVIRI